MYTFRHLGRRPPAGVAPWQWLLALLLAAAWPFASSQASCVENPDPEIHRLQVLTAENGAKAVKEAQAMLDELKTTPLPDPLKNASRIAALYAVQAEAYEILEMDEEARKSAAQGLAIATGVHDPLHVELLTAYAENVFQKPGLASARESIEQARMLQPTGSVAEICLLNTRGLLEYQDDRADLAIVTLTQAYRSSIAPAVTEPHIIAADNLALVLRSVGDYPEALKLNQEKIDWDTAHNATASLAVSHFGRGQILRLMQNYRAAIVEYTQSRDLSRLCPTGPVWRSRISAFANRTSSSDSSDSRSASARMPCAPSAACAPPTP